MADFAKIDVKEIECNVSRSSFSEDDIEALSDLILSSDGMFRPLILKQVGVEKYVVIEGQLEYFAAVRAREKNPRKGEMVNAFLVTSSDEAVIQNQIELLNSTYRKTSDSRAEESSQHGNRGDGKNSEWISSFEKRLGEVREELFQVKRDHEYRFTRLEKDLDESSKLDLLELINTLDSSDLVSELSRYGVTKGKVEAIHNARSSKERGKFDSYQDVVKSTKGLGAEGVLNLIDAWERINKRKK